MYEKQGYLHEQYKIFYLKDISDRKYEFHYHDFYKLILFIKGSAAYSIEGRNYELSPMDFVLVSKNEIHRPVICEDTEYERIVLYLSQGFVEGNKYIFDSFKRACEEHVSVIKLPFQDAERIMGILLSAAKKVQSDDFAREEYGRLFVTEALLSLNESIVKNGLNATGNVIFNQKIVDICEYINSHLSEELGIDDLSKRFFISKYYFMRMFKESTGYSVHKYILEKRLLNTAELVKKGEKVTAAAVMSGFRDYSTYLRARKKAFALRESEGSVKEE